MCSGLVCSNGTAWSPDGNTMYHTESFRYTIFAYDFDGATGSPMNRRIFAQVDPSSAGFQMDCAWMLKGMSGVITSGAAALFVTIRRERSSARSCFRFRGPLDACLGATI